MGPAPPAWKGKERAPEIGETGSQTPTNDNFAGSSTAIICLTFSNIDSNIETVQLYSNLFERIFGFLLTYCAL
jgi:hypothetical protein